MVYPWYPLAVTVDLQNTHFNLPTCSRWWGRYNFQECPKVLHLLLAPFSSFEFLAFVISGIHMVLCLHVYRTPEPNIDFISEFPQIAPIHDNIIILGDFNINVCCPSKAMTCDFIKLLQSLGLKQYMNGKTQSYRTYFRFSSLLRSLHLHPSPTRWQSFLIWICCTLHPALLFCSSHILNSSKAIRLAEAYSEAPIITGINAAPSHLNVEELV